MGEDAHGEFRTGQNKVRIAAVHILPVCAQNRTATHNKTAMVPATCVGWLCTPTVIAATIHAKATRTTSPAPMNMSTGARKAVHATDANRARRNTRTRWDAKMHANMTDSSGRREQMNKRPTQHSSVAHWLLAIATPPSVQTERMGHVAATRAHAIWARLYPQRSERSTRR